MAASYQIGSLTIPKGKNREESWFAHARLNMAAQVTATGETLVFDESGTTMLRGVLVFDLLPEATAAAVRSWVVDSLRFWSGTFSIIPPSFDDIGKGPGQRLDGCRLDTQEPSTEQMLTPQGRLGRWRLSLPYRLPIAADEAYPVES